MENFKQVILLVILVGLSIHTDSVLAQEIKEYETSYRILFSGVTLHDNKIVFSYSGDLWEVPKSGGTVKLFSDDEAWETRPIFSPDGTKVAYSKFSDVYVKDINSGSSIRLTYHPLGDFPMGWTTDGTEVLFSSFRLIRGNMYQLWTIPYQGGFPQMVPTPFAYNGSYSPDGKQLIYQAFWFDPTYRYYRGGKMRSLKALNIADTTHTFEIPWKHSKDESPMWIGDAIYFVSDRDGFSNLYSYSIKTKQIKKHTQLKGVGITDADFSKHEIIYVVGGRLYLFDTKTETSTLVPIDLPKQYINQSISKSVSADDWIQQGSIHSGNLMAFQVRGDILVTDGKGETRNITRTSEIAERYPVIAPNGKLLAYISDESGEYELIIYDLENNEPINTIRIEEQSTIYRNLTWSPNSNYLVASDQRLKLWLINIEAGSSESILESEYMAQEGYHPSWSPNSRYLAYSKASETGLRSIYIYDLLTKNSRLISDGFVHSEYPVFDKSGKYLYFTGSDNQRLASSSDISFWTLLSGFNARRLISKQLLAVPLSRASNQSHKDSSGIDFQNIQQRVQPLPIDRKYITGIQAGVPGELLLKVKEWSGTPIEDNPFGIPTTLYRFSLAQADKIVRLSDNVDELRVDNSGENILFSNGEKWHVLSLDDNTNTAISLTEEINVDLRLEWNQMFQEMWRKVRDTFFDANFSGQDLSLLKRHYIEYLPTIRNRIELTVLLREMVGYLSVGHINIGFGDADFSSFQSTGTGLLGADFSIENGRYKFKEIFRSGHFMNPDQDARASLSQPGINIDEGDYLLAVDGMEVTSDKNLYSYFVGKDEKKITLGVSSTPDTNDLREFKVVTMGNDRVLRKEAWIRKNRETVERLSGGDIGYVYIGSFGSDGVQRYLGQYLGQQDKKALIIDVRFNGGGITSDYLIDLLMHQPLYHYRYRYGSDFTVMPNHFSAPKVLLTNFSDYSAAETFAYMFQLAGIGPIVGTRTAGEVIGASLFQETLIDGGSARISNRAAHDGKGNFGPENKGVIPDIEIEYGLKDWKKGTDSQLLKAIEVIMEELKTYKEDQLIDPVMPEYPGIRGQ